MEFYYFPVSLFSQKAQMALYEKGVEYKGVYVDLMDQKSCKAYREEHYPLGRLPLLKVDGRMIPESTIIIEYLDQYYPEPRLIPEDPDDARQVRFRERMGDNYLIEPTLTIFFQGFKPEDQRDEKRIAKAHNQLETMYGLLQKHLDGKTDSELFMHGGSFTMADITAVLALNSLRSIKPYDDFPALKAYFAKHSQRESFQRVIEEAKPVLATMVAKLSSKEAEIVK